MEQVLALYDRQQYRSRYPEEPVICLAYAARALWLLGYPDQALKRSREALTLARELSHSFSLGFALAFAAAELHQFRREGQAAQECAEAAARLSTEHEFPVVLAAGTILPGLRVSQSLSGRGGPRRQPRGQHYRRTSPR